MDKQETDLHGIDVALGELEDRVTILERSNDMQWRARHLELHHSIKDSDTIKRNIVRGLAFIEENAELFAALCIVVIVNIVVWRKL